MMTIDCLKFTILSAAALGLSALAAGCSGAGKGEAHSDSENIHTEEEQVADGHEHHGELIEFDDKMADHFGVTTRMVAPSDFYNVIPVSGRIETKASDESVATATRSGILTLAPDVNAGSIVSAGAPIGKIAVAGVQGGNPAVQTRAARDAAKRELDRMTPLHKEGIVSDQKYNEALRAYEEADAALRTSSQGSATVSAPKGGVVTRLLAKSGEYVEAGQKIAVVSGNRNLTLRADVPEKYISQMQTIESANFRPASSDYVFSLESLGGKMISNPGVAVSEGGYIPLYFIFNNDGSVAPGAFAEVYLKSGVRHGVLSVPVEAIVETSGNKCVYSKVKDGHYAKHVVTTGATDGRNVEILSGLHENENVVVKGSQIIRMAETSSTAVPGHTHNH